MEGLADPADARAGVQAVDPILLVHNRYRQAGGEDVVFEAEARLLERHGHRVHRLVADNRRIPRDGTPASAVRLAARTVWARSSSTAIARAIDRIRPGIVHVHNFFPVLSPSVHATAHRLGVPVVQTLHNYRLVCPAATLLRDGLPCHDCLGRPVAWPSILHACYRASRSQSAVTATMLAVHRARGTWRRDVDLFLALTEFGRQIVAQGGLPAERIMVKPNFLDHDPGSSPATGRGVLFVGRLAPEKGIETLLDAWASDPDLPPCRVVGDGPLAEVVRSRVARDGRLEYLGRLPPDAVAAEMRQAAAVIVPSLWYEGFPMTVVEAFAAGRPVVASRLGALGELVEDGETGLLVSPGDPGALGRAVRRIAQHPSEARRMGEAARVLFIARYSAEPAYDLLATAYLRASGLHRSTCESGPR